MQRSVVQYIIINVCVLQEVQSAIERLVNSLAELRRQCVKDSAVVSQNKQAKPSNDFACSDLEPPAAEISMRKIVRLEKRLKYCWLRSLEYQFLLESFLQNFDPMTVSTGQSLKDF